jgi:DNA replication and repair protein RecF
LKLQRAQYQNFRNHSFLTFEPVDGINLIHGRNGSGKTSLLEGIHYCALTRGFVSTNDSECLAFKKDYFLLESTFLSETESLLTVKLSYTKEKEKQIIVNNSEIKPFSRHIGTIPCITFSPPEIVIVNGAPGERRRFLDNAICQTNRRYLNDLLAYRRVLNQRNALLLQLHDNQTVHKEMLPLWNETLARLAASIVHTRVQFITSFFDRFKEIYGQLFAEESPGISYRSSLGKIDTSTSVDNLYSLFIRRYEETQRREIFRTQTLTGPHRDDLIFLLNGNEIKKYASQGQLRTFLIALKLAQHRFFYDTLGEKPLCLLDDIFSELDSSRIADIFVILETCGQSIITSTEKKGHNNITQFSIEYLKTKVS